MYSYCQKGFLSINYGLHILEENILQVRHGITEPFITDMVW